MTASGFPIPGAVSFFNAWNHWRRADLPLWRDPFGPPSSGRVRVLYLGRSPVKQPGFFLPFILPTV